MAQIFTHLKGFASCNTLISDWPKYSLTQSAKNLRILILLNIKWPKYSLTQMESISDFASFETYLL